MPHMTCRFAWHTFCEAWTQVPELYPFFGNSHISI